MNIFLQALLINETKLLLSSEMFKLANNNILFSVSLKWKNINKHKVDTVSS